MGYCERKKFTLYHYTDTDCSESYRDKEIYRATFNSETEDVPVFSDPGTVIRCAKEKKIDQLAKKMRRPTPANFIKGIQKV